MTTATLTPPAAAATDKPAIAGGKPTKTTPFTKDKKYGDDELKELKEALDQGSLFYAHGKKVYALEQEYSAKMGFKHGVATSSGTTAIHTALIAAGVSPGDEVIVAPITDMGSIVPILYQGAVPVFADLDPHTYNLSPESVEKNITPRTTAIVVVHLAGNACDMDALVAIAKKHDLRIIEDCAQAHGCTYRGKAVGHYGVAGCYSFNEFKHIGCGDGGLVVCNDPDFARRARLATDKCYNREPNALIRQPNFLANNYRMTELQGAVGRAQVRKLDSIISRRRAWCTELTRRLAAADLKGLSLPKVQDGCEHSYWFYLMRVNEELMGCSTDDFAAAMKAEGVALGAHYIANAIYEYPIFVNHSAYAHGSAHPYSARSYAKGLCPNAEAILKTCVMLPVNEGYTQQDLDETTAAITKVARWYHGKRA